MKAMYPAQANSPGTELATAIDTVQDTIEVVDGSVLPDAPNLLTIGTDESAETILYTEKVGNKMMGVTRGFQGTAQSWRAGTKVARCMTAYDHDTARENIEGVYGRLDNAESASTILQPGLQVVTATKDARFKLDEIRGRTMINLLGAPGSCDGISGWNITGSVTGTLTVETTNKDQGNSLKATRTGSAGSMYVRSSVFPIDPSKHLVVLGWIKNPSPDPSTHVSVRLVANNASVSATKASYCAGGETKVVFRAFTPAELGSASTASVDTFSSTIFNNGDHYFMDSVRVYQITAEEYADIDTLTQQELNEKYPFVPGGIIGAENPYAIATSDNLLPPFYEWVALSLPAGVTYTIDKPYKMTLNDPGQQVGAVSLFYTLINVPKNTDITLRLPNDTWNTISDANGDNLFYSWEKSTGQTINTGSNDLIRVYLGNRDGAGLYLFENPLLTVGTEPQSFQPQQKSMLALQTELHANPTDGTDPDALFHRVGGYLKLAKWKKVIVDGSLPWRLIHAAGTGYKNPITSISGLPKIKGTNQGCVTNYRGSILSPSTPNAEGGFYIDSSNIVLSIPNTDSGWGDTYSPTADEIKAYFNGWKMYQEGNRDTPYTSGKKQWFKINKINESSVDVLPTSSYAEWTPYQLLYRLALEAVESITLEGSLTLTEGNNMVEVGTGIVLRESVKPKQHANTNWIINNMGVGSMLANMATSIKAIYRDSRRDFKWIKEAVIGAWGIEQAFISNSNYDQSAAYSVTYTKLDKSPIVPITGSLAANEKAQISDLTAGVAEALQRVSVVEQKKAEKDAPGWIKPVLLNGWIDYSGTYPSAFFKDSSGIVHIRGLIKSGAITSDTIIFTLPPGYRPKGANMQIPQVTLDSSSSTEHVGRIMIDTLGHVRVGKASTGFLTLHASFLAEQ